MKLLVVIYFTGKMIEKKLTDKFPALIGSTLTLFRYDRWEYLLFLKAYSKVEEEVYLACYDCQFFEFSHDVCSDKILITQNIDTISLNSSSYGFHVNCFLLELWRKDRFYEYERNLNRNLSEEKRYGVRHPIFSIEDLI